MAIKYLNEIKKHLFLCNGGSCKIAGAELSTNIIRSTIKEIGLAVDIHTTKTLCNGRCNDAPVVISMPDGKWYRKVDPSIAADFTKRLLLNHDCSEEHILFNYNQQISPDQE